MGRKPAEPLLQICDRIIEAALEIVGNGGEHLSARSIANRAGCSPGHLYNLFHNLDDLILHVEALVLERLEARLRLVPQDLSPRDYLVQFASAYLAFSHEEPGAWMLLARHDVNVGRSTPDWYAQKLGGLVGLVQQALAPVLPAGSSDAATRAAQTLWAAIHGIVTLSTIEKTTVVNSDNAGVVLETLVTTYLAGLSPLAAATPRRTELPQA